MQGNFLLSSLKLSQYYQSLGHKTFDQLSDEDLHWEPGVDSNSIAIIVRHITGNIYSRFTNFLTEDGEKTWRNRDSEFKDDLLNKEEISSRWEEAWVHFQKLLSTLQEGDLGKIVFIRNEGHTALEAIQRQLTHYAYHTGQIVMIGKMIKGTAWKSLSIPRNQSEMYNKQKFDQEKSNRHFTDDED